MALDAISTEPKAFDVGVTAGDADRFINDLATALNTRGNSAANGDGGPFPVPNGAATTLTVTTNANVTVSDMKVRIVVYYREIIAPTA